MKGVSITESAHADNPSADIREALLAAIATKSAVSFRYHKADGTVTRHNAVYPKQLFEQGQHTLVRAYCHFTRDWRAFHVDRIRRIRIRRRLPQVPLRYEILGAAGAIALVITIFLLLLFFSPKYRWRQLRHQLLGGRYTIQQTQLARGLASGLTTRCS